MIKIAPVYLGDAVYASFDGFQILLHLDRHDNPPLIALEPEVMKGLIEYAEAIRLTPPSLLCKDQQENCCQIEDCPGTMGYVMVDGQTRLQCRHCGCPFVVDGFPVNVN